MDIGDKIMINSRLYRTGTLRFKGYDKKWESTKIVAKQVIFLGWRTLSNGAVIIDEDCKIYQPKEHFKVALVKAYDNTNPFYVLAEEIEVK